MLLTLVGVEVGFFRNAVAKILVHDKRISSVWRSHSWRHNDVDVTTLLNPGRKRVLLDPLLDLIAFLDTNYLVIRVVDLLGNGNGRGKAEEQGQSRDGLHSGYGL